MSTLLIRLSGPMQSWGSQSRFSERDTGLEPSKSGVIGLLCAAEGRPRNADLRDIAALRFGVRVDRAGVLKRDYQTALDVAKSNRGAPDTVVSNRYYLADAAFLVGIDGDLELLRRLDAALAAPRWPLSLGRKSYVPGAPVRLTDGLRADEARDEALRQYPPVAAPSRGQGSRYRVILDDPYGPIVRQDVPTSFAERRFGTRRVSVTWWEASFRGRGAGGE